MSQRRNSSFTTPMRATRGVLLVLSLAVLLPGLSTSPLYANIILNGSFEAGGNCNGGTNCNVRQAPWIFTTVEPDPTLVAFGVSPLPAPNGGLRGAYFGGMTVGLFDTISQDVTTTSGQLYNLTFWLDTASSGSHAVADFRVLWNGVVVYDDPAGSDAAHQFSYKPINVQWLLGTGHDTLAFQGYNPPGNDRFDLVDLEAAPEPAAWTLMSLGAIALACLRRRLT
jgi:hypothetical protein